MKIYNKKKFTSGSFLMILGNASLILDIVNDQFDIKSVIIVAALLLFGFGEIVRSLSRKMSKEDKLEGMDERNKLIALKSKSKAFQLTQTISFLLMLALLVMGKAAEYEGFIAIAVGLAFAFAISMFSELFTCWYYETKN